MKLSTNLKLKLIEGTEIVNIDDITSNFEVLDTEVAAIKNGSANMPTLTTTAKTIQGAINELKAKDDTLSTQMAEKVNKPTTATAGRVAQFDDSKNVVDSGFTIAKSVPSDAKFTDTIYTHPTGHSASMITEEINKRFMTDAERAKLGGIAIGATKVVNSASNGSIVINDTPAIVYTHPTGTNPHGTTKSDVGLSLVDNVKQAPFTHTHAEYDKVVTGSYVGNGVNPRIITLGFTPSFVILYAMFGSSGNEATLAFFSTYGARELLGTTLYSSHKVVTNGIQVNNVGFSTNVNGFVYNYVAFK